MTHLEAELEERLKALCLAQLRALADAQMVLTLTITLTLTLGALPRGPRRRGRGEAPVHHGRRAEGGRHVRP